MVKVGNKVNSVHKVSVSLAERGLRQKCTHEM